MKKIITILFLVLILISASCSNPTEIDNKIKPVRDPRTFAWTVDTIKYDDPNASQIRMSSIWGSSPNDVYFCGHNSLPLEGKLWHYNGSKLEEIKLNEKLSLNWYDLTKVFGFSKNDVWVIGDQVVDDPQHIVGSVRTPLIARFDGVNWKQYRLNFYKDHTTALLGINGDSPNNLWVCGYDGLVAHFNGVDWIQDTVVLDNSAGKEFNISDVTVYKDQVYLQGQLIKADGIYNQYYSIKGTIKNWKVIDSFWANETPKFGYTNLYSGFGKLYSILPNVYEYDNSSWSTIITLPSDYRAINMSGTDENNILICSYNGLFHWNGADIKQMELPNYHYGDLIWGVWLDGQEAFAVGFSYFDATKSFFWHGK